MQVTETLSEGLRREYAIVVAAADIEGKRTAKLAEIGRTVRLPGFRPGKVPLNLVRQRYGTAVMSEVLQDTVNSATQQVLTDRGLRPAGQPKIAVTQVADAQDLQFNVEVELLPEIAMPDFGAIHLTKFRAEPTPEAVEAALTEVASRQKELEPVTEDRGAQAGDTLTVVVPEYSLSGGSQKRPPTVKSKEVEHEFTLHEEALVRWSRKPDRKDDKGRAKPFTPAEMRVLQAPPGAPGFLGDKLELAPAQTVELTLLVPAKVRPEELTTQYYRVKWVVIQGAPPDPKDVKLPEPKKKK